MPSVDDQDVEPGPSLHEMVRMTRYWAGLSLRGLERETGVSAGQLSRIESGETVRPSIKTLLALAPALRIHPSLLLALADHLDVRTARRELANLVKEGRDELARDYEDQGEYADELTGRAESVANTEEIRGVAMELATLTIKTVGSPRELETQAPSRVADRAMLHELITTWEILTAERRWRLLQTANDFATASASEDRPEEM